MLYANADGFDPFAEPAPALSSRPLLDRWILSRLAGTVRDVREGMDGYDATGAGRRIQSFVDDLSNWYVRRSRRRFWNPGGRGGAESVAAFHTLHECLVTVATLLAPFVPFVSEEIWSNLTAERAGRPDSVHLADYPQVQRMRSTPARRRDCARTARRRARAPDPNGDQDATRQPLPAAVCIFLPPGIVDSLRGTVAEE